ncbi:MAG: molybdopterin-dependent oxidoreductase, partial [Thermoleophilia bacterium]|nr:molybdopterin-dependent oxidoreductase [Thermoleophilia bacterium]
TLADKAQAARAAGGEAFALICGTRCTNEAAYLAQKLSRTVFESHNVYAGDILEHQATEKVLGEALGLTAATNSRADLRLADTILVVGANLTESNPVLALEVIWALRHGKTVIVVDPRHTDLARRARFHLPVKPGADAILLRAMVAHIIAQGWENKAFVAEHTEGFEALRQAVADVNLEAEADACGVGLETVKAATAAFAQAGCAAILYGSGVAQGPEAEATIGALVDLALLTGNLGRPGTGIYPLRSGANSQGLADMGVRPDRLPGGLSVGDAGAVARLEAAWGCGLSHLAPGGGVLDIVEAAEAGKLQFLYVIGDDPALGLPDSERVQAALKKVGFLVVQDSLTSDTAAMADLVLPAAAPPEDEGTYTNGERVVQRVRPAVPPPGESLPDWRILQLVANRLGADWTYACPEDVMREVAEIVPAYGGLSYARLEEEGVAWPCAVGGDCGAPFLQMDAFTGGKGRFVPLASVETRDGTSAEFPFLLVTGSVREHHETGVRTRRAAGLTSLRAEAEVEVNPRDAERLGLKQGGRVRVASSSAAITLSARVTDRVPEGVVFVPRFSCTAPVSRLLRFETRGGGEEKAVTTQPVRLEPLS